MEDSTTIPKKAKDNQDPVLLNSQKHFDAKPFRGLQINCEDLSVRNVRMK